MLVYGDPQFTARLSEMCTQLDKSLARCGGSNVDELRALLIQAGQLEQAVLDQSESGELSSRCQRLTDDAAGAFYAAWAEGDGALPQALRSSKEALADLATELGQLPSFHTKALTIKVPEGFEFYALYPEQYAAAALQWASDHAKLLKETVLVVGLRSIGTGLSAIVTVALEAAGWSVCRRTVRPQGDPFRRKLNLESLGQITAREAIIVDEGPGLSGSSLVGTAQALFSAGFSSERVAIFPGHEGEPGSAASPKIRQCWKSLRKYFVPLKEMRWRKRSLIEALANKSSEYERGFCEALDDLSGGGWRQFAYKRPEDWPAVAAQFERMKFRVRMSSGASVFWKFCGLGALVAPSTQGDGAIRQRLLAGADLKFCPDLLGSFRGFSAQVWIGGSRFTGGDIQPEMVRHMARYLVSTAGPPLSAVENETGVARLADMLYWNSRKALGDGWETEYPVAQIAKLVNGLPSYSDGRMAPQEWLRTPAGQVFKLDSAGHIFDHTLVGQQCILWDVAGLIMEWKLDARAAACLLKELNARGIRIPLAALRFYKQACAAFRLGQTKLCLMSCPGGDAEHSRLLRAAEYFAQVLQPA